MFAGLALAALVTAPASASNIPDNLSPSLTYKVVGTITPSCSLSQGTREVEVIGLQDEATDTVRATETDLPFTITCTAPVQVTMGSAHGGLKAGNQSGDSDFTGLVPYQATLDFPGSAAVLECQSGSMIASENCARTLDGEAYDGDGRIRLRTNASGQLLLAGTYQDTVTLTVSPRLDGSSQSADND